MGSEVCGLGYEIWDLRYGGWGMRYGQLGMKCGESEIGILRYRVWGNTTGMSGRYRD